MSEKDELIEEFKRWACGVVPVKVINEVEKAIKEREVVARFTVYDLEKTIRGLEICSAGDVNSNGGRLCTDCPFYPAGYTGCTAKRLLKSALSILKSHEHQIAYWIPCSGKSHIWYCSHCGEKINCNTAHRVYKKDSKTVDQINRFCRGCGYAMVPGATNMTED